METATQLQGSDIRELVEREARGWESINSFSLFNRFLLRNGKVFTYEPVPDAERGQIGQCFHNVAMRLPVAGGGYCEGLATAADNLPLHHAWVGVGDKAFEVTWSPMLISGKPRGTPQYLGVMLTDDQHAEATNKTGTWSAFTDGVTWNSELMFQIDPGLYDLAKSYGFARD